MQRPPIIPTLLFCLVTKVTYKYNNVNYALFLCSLGRLTHCRSQFSLFLPVLRFAYSSTGRAQLRTSPAARRISHGAAIFHIAKAIFHPFVRTDFTARVSALTLFLHQRFLSHLPRFRPLPCLPRQTAPFQDGTGRCAYSTHTWLCCKPPSPSGTRATPA